MNSDPLFLMKNNAVERRIYQPSIMNKWTLKTNVFAII